MTHEEFEKACSYWERKDADTVKMDDETLGEEIRRYLRANNTCALATGYGEFVRCTPMEYGFHDDALWMFSEGGKKFAALERNPNVCAAIFNPYEGFGRICGMQVSGRAELIEPFSDAYVQAAAWRKLPLAALKKLEEPMHLIRIAPERVDFLCSDFKKRGFGVRQHSLFRKESE